MTLQYSPSADRRTVLAGLAASLGSVGFAGCIGATDDEETGDSDDDESDDDGSDDEPSDGDSDGDEEAEIHAEYESTEVRVETDDGEELGAVTAAIADTQELRQLGLSDTETLPEDRGMVFVYDEVEERTFGMPDMDFGIDIVFADDEGVITGIEHAPEPESGEDGSEQTYSGRAQYVLEVAYEWTAEHTVEEGDVLTFDP